MIYLHHQLLNQQMISNHLISYHIILIIQEPISHHYKRMNSKQLPIKNTTIDQCFQPLLQKFYQQQFKQQDLDILNQQLMQSSSVKKHQALIGIYNLLISNPKFINKIITSGLLFKLIFYLKEEQFPQLCFQSLRLLNLVISHGKIAQYLVNSGGVNSLLNLVRQKNNKILMGTSLYTLIAIANRVGGTKLDVPQNVGVNDFIILAEDVVNKNKINGIIIHFIVELWTNHMFLRPQDLQRFERMILKQIIKVNIKDDRLIKQCFQLLESRNIDFVRAFSQNNWALLKRVIASLQGQQNYILTHYIKFLVQISIKKPLIIFKQKLISLDVFKIFESLLDYDEDSQYLFCQLVYDILNSNNLNGLKYFLQKSSVLIKFYYLIESGSNKIKKSICSIFTSLTAFKSQDVLLLYQEAKIVALYFRLLKQNQLELVQICLISLIKILRFVQGMSLTTFNWFINYLKSEKVEQTIQQLNVRIQSDRIKNYAENLLQFFIQKQNYL